MIHDEKKGAEQVDAAIKKAEQEAKSGQQPQPMTIEDCEAVAREAERICHDPKNASTLPNY